MRRDRLDDFVAVGDVHELTDPLGIEAEGPREIEVVHVLDLDPPVVELVEQIDEALDRRREDVVDVDVDAARAHDSAPMCFRPCSSVSTCFATGSSSRSVVDHAPSIGSAICWSARRVARTRLI